MVIGTLKGANSFHVSEKFELSGFTFASFFCSLGMNEGVGFCEHVVVE